MTDLSLGQAQRLTAPAPFALLSVRKADGRDHDKAAEFGIPLEAASTIPASLVSGSRAAFECRLVSTAEAGDHVFYLAEILTCRGDAEIKQLFAWDGYARLGTV